MRTNLESTGLEKFHTFVVAHEGRIRLLVGPKVDHVNVMNDRDEINESSSIDRL
jgi:hypothetical protein